MQAPQKENRLYYGWIVMGVSFVCLLATFGMRSAFGAYVASWEEEFLIGRTQVSLISVLSMVTFIIFQPVMGRMIDRYGSRLVLTVSIFMTGTGIILSSLSSSIWQLIILYSLIASIGMAGGSTVTVTAVVAQWFVKKRGTVMGLVLSGMSFGQFIMGPASVLLIDNFDWRFAMRVIGILILVIVTPLCFFLVRSKPQDMGLKPYGAVEDVRSEKKNKTEPVENVSGEILKGFGMSIFRNRIFWLLTIPYFVCGFTDVGLVSTHFIPFAEGKGYASFLIAAVFGTIAIFNIFGTVGAGFLSDKLNRAALLRFVYWLRAIIFILLITVFNNAVGLFLFAAIFGLTERATIAPTSSLCAHHFDDLSLGVVFGYVSISHHLGGALGSLIPGALFDITGSYNIAFILAVIMLLAGGLLVARVPDS
ncbi:MAG: MFS transporter [Bacillota bacterium]|nr:MFS transporter [Bacillota bacterium]